MAVRYPNLLNLRMTDVDLIQLEEISERLDTPKSTLVRRIWREWLKTQLPQKDLSQNQDGLNAAEQCVESTNPLAA